MTVTCAVAMVLLLVAAPGATGATEQAGTVREAWYQAPIAQGADPLCQAPAACNPTNPTGYPDDTLHVGNFAGNTTELTVVTFDLSVVPSTAELTGGIAELPVADSSAGTSSPESAAFVACLVTASFEEADGAPASEAPEYDCATSAPATYAPEPAPGRFTVDLTPFLDSWRAGTGQGIALIPAEDDTGTWHVAFSERERQGEDVAPPITARFTFTSPAADDRDAGDDDVLIGPGQDSTSPSEDAGSSSGAFAPPAFTSNGSSAPVTGPQPEVAPPPVDEPQPVAAAPAPPPAAAPSPVPTGYPYAWGWLMPLVLLVAAGGLARSLAQDVEVLPDDAPRGLASRVRLALRPGRA